MMVNLKYILVVFLLSCSSWVLGQRPPSTVFELHESNDSNDGHAFMNGTLFQTVKRYHCAWQGQANATASTLMLYGSKSWTFPHQNVQLDLTYPDFRTNSTGALVSMFDVILRIGGVHSQGYITSGGLLQEFITLSFLFTNISSLEYELWLYGVPRWAVDPIEQFNNHLHDLC